MQRDDADLEHDRAREDASSSQARNGTTNNEDGRIWCGTADGGSDFKDENADEEDDLRAIESIESSKEELKGAAGEHVSTSIPSNVLKRVKVIGDSGDSCGNDRPSQCHEECGQV